MNLSRGRQLSLLIPVTLAAGITVAQGEEGDWAERLARKFSPRWSAIGREAAEIRSGLPEYPGVPVYDQGGTGGFASIEGSADGKSVATVTFPQAGPVDLIALVPARRYGVKGLDPQFGLPDEFHIDLLDAGGKEIHRVDGLRDVRAIPVRAGHPFLFKVDPPVEAAALRITATKLKAESEVSTFDEAGEKFVHAWAEAFVFSGTRNLALGGRVEGGSSSFSAWQWGNAFLVDGLTPLGLPEMPAGPHPNVGWMSEGRQRATDSVWVEIDLGEPREFDAVRIFPAKRPTGDLPSGFGFPRKFDLIFQSPGEEPVRKEFQMPNPGHNPVRIELGVQRGRTVKLDATELWKAYENFPAFAAYSEIEVLKGEENLATGAPVRSSGGMGAVVGSGVQYWIASSLSDGFGPDGKLVPQRDWLLALDRRLALETQLHHLGREADEILVSWRRAGLSMAAILAVAAVFLLVYLPLRYRARAKRELVRVRERIAGDLHDEVGSNLGSIQMLADLAEGQAGAPKRELKRIQRIAAETVSAVRDIVWLLRPQGDHRIGTVEHLRETSSIMLEQLEWEFTANEAAWQCEMGDEANRHLFLFFREALHNLLRHSGAKRATVHVECDPAWFRLTVTDDGSGIPPEKLARPSTLRALRQRVEALGAEFGVDSDPGRGTTLKLGIPLGKRKARAAVGTPA